MRVHRNPALLPLAAVLAVGAAAPAVAHGHHDHGHHERGPAAAVRVVPTDVPALATIGGTTITGGAYGSSFVAKPGSDRVFYGLTDRGPNVDSPTGGKIEPLPDFQPAIGEFVLRHDGTARLVRRIGLSAADGTPYDGQVNPGRSTNETITDLAGTVLPPSVNGYDPEGLVALRDGTFWVSDEYGPFITHVDRHGRAVERLAPGAGLPAELAEREPNKGMEGLTVTPDGRTLVGIMQSGLNAPDGPKSKNLSALRIVTVDLRSRATHQYLYLLHNSGAADTAVSEIAALDDHRFLVDERDGNPEPGANKKLFVIDLRGATDVGATSRVPGSTYDAAKGGLLVGGRSVEAIAGKAGTADTTAALAGAGIRPVSSRLFLDVGGLVTAVDPTGGYFGHDKVEGVAVLDHGRKVVLSNDNDFGIIGVNETQAPFTLTPKLLPDGQQDDGELLVVDMRKVPSAYR